MKIINEKKMSTIFTSNVLSTEITTIPIWITTILGEYYNNTLCNGATWILVLWKVLHILYNHYMQGYLKQIGTRQYVRTRLAGSLWFCVFFSAVLTYYFRTLDENKLDLLLRGSHVTLNENVPIKVVFAYIVICTFYLHTAFSEGIQEGSLHSSLKYLLLVVICTLSYILRFLEIPFTLSALIAIPAISEEITKIFYILLSHVNNGNNMFVRTLYIVTLVLYIFIHLALIPLIFLIPLGKMTLLKNRNTVITILFSSLLLWVGTTIYNSILSKSILHWLDHVKRESTYQEEEGKEEKNKRKTECPGNLFECSLFPMRTDEAYILGVFRSDVKERKMEMDAKKKPKARSVLIQTLKCMMAIKKKLKHKNLSESFAADTFNESVEDYHNKAVDDQNEDIENDYELELNVDELTEELLIEDESDESTNEQPSETSKSSSNSIDGTLENDESHEIACNVAETKTEDLDDGIAESVDKDNVATDKANRINENHK